MRPRPISPRTSVVYTNDAMTITQTAQGKGSDQSIVLTAETAERLVPILARFLQKTETPGSGEPGVRQGEETAPKGGVRRKIPPRR